ncbi:hypothetical protein RCL_jg8710.t1 [Rhizophagus clarus]|uniref:Uncharacterized protein n=1 Tax=Rhizophagus clarus TaxID=94130 RepID=A0A8H3M487_9GLOM|nr:hypothetical protein RCL_jg8710.t1 [Rhizophagus clarus]
MNSIKGINRSKKETEVKVKERIILQKNDKIAKLLKGGGETRQSLNLERSKNTRIKNLIENGEIDGDMKLQDIKDYTRHKMYRQVGRNTAVNREIMDMDTYATTYKEKYDLLFARVIRINETKYLEATFKTEEERKGSHINECVDNRTKEPIKDYKDDVVVVNEHEDTNPEIDDMEDLDTNEEYKRYIKIGFEYVIRNEQEYMKYIMERYKQKLGEEKIEDLDPNENNKRKKNREDTLYRTKFGAKSAKENKE